MSDLKSGGKELLSIEKELATLKLPISFAKDLYDLRLHVSFVREKLDGWIETPTAAD